MKWGDDYKKESDRYWAKRDDANKQSNTFKTELNSLNSDYQQLTNEVKLFGEQSRKKKKEKKKKEESRFALQEQGGSSRQDFGCAHRAEPRLRLGASCVHVCTTGGGWSRGLRQTPPCPLLLSSTRSAVTSLTDEVAGEANQLKQDFQWTRSSTLMWHGWKRE
jgi:hypothetical protein